MKSYQFFKIFKHFDKQKENTYVAVNEKEKQRKVGLCFVTGCFIGPYDN